MAAADFPKHLRVIRQLGRGAYGTVHLCEDTSAPGSPQVAVKHVRHAARHGKSILREVRLLARLCHENLLHLLDFPAVPSPNFEDVFLILPYMPSDLHKVIQSKQPLTDRHVQVITVQILRALGHLHAAGVAHRDLKPANILLSADCKVKICDFGLARGDMPDADGDDQEQQGAGVLTEYVVTRWYRAPEVMLLPKQYTSAVDLWSIGCILCEILGRQALFRGRNHIDMICRVAEILGTPPDEELTWLPRDSDAYRFLRKVCPQSKGVELCKIYVNASAKCLDLTRGLLQWDPARRLTAMEAQQHGYVDQYLAKDPPAPPEPFDWSFDGFKPTASAVKERLYLECSRYHPEILERDRAPPPPVAAAAAPVVSSPPPPAGGYPQAGGVPLTKLASTFRPPQARRPSCDSRVAAPIQYRQQPLAAAAHVPRNSPGMLLHGHRTSSALQRASPNGAVLRAGTPPPSTTPPGSGCASDSHSTSAVRMATPPPTHRLGTWQPTTVTTSHRSASNERRLTAAPVGRLSMAPHAVPVRAM